MDPDRDEAPRSGLRWSLFDRLVGWLRPPASPTNDYVVVTPPSLAPQSAERLYFEVARSRLEAQLANVEINNTKSATMFATGSTVLPITVSLLSIERVDVLEHETARWAIGVGCACYLILVVAFVLSHRLGGWQNRPELGQWQAITVGRSEEEMHRWLGDAYVEAYLSNRPQLRRKTTLTGLVLWMLAGEAIALTVAVTAPIL